MSEQKLRRKSFIVTLGALALGWMGIRRVAAGTGLPDSPERAGGAVAEGRVKGDPRAVPCAGRTL